MRWPGGKVRSEPRLGPGKLTACLVIVDLQRTRMVSVVHLSEATHIAQSGHQRRGRVGQSFLCTFPEQLTAANNTADTRRPCTLRREGSELAPPLLPPGIFHEPNEICACERRDFFSCALP